MIYQEKISGIMIRLAFPVYSRTTDLKELRRFHERATRIHAAVLLPLLTLLIVTAPDLVPWLFGERWAPAVEPVQILCVAGMIAAILTGYPQIMLAAGKPRALLVFNVFLLALYVARLLDRRAVRHHRARRSPWSACTWCCSLSVYGCSSSACSGFRSSASSPTSSPPSPAAC